MDKFSGLIIKTSSNFSRGLSIVSNTFGQNINIGYDLVFVLITGSVCLRLGVSTNLWKFD